MAYRSSVDHFVHGGIVLRIVLVGVCVILSLFTVWLYWKTGLNRYQATDEGLVVSRLQARRVIPWEEIDEMIWNRLAHCVFIKGKGRTLVFTSTDIFDDLPDLMAEIFRRTQCKLSSDLVGVFPETADETSG
jgi:hypothetical protein